MHRVVFIVYVTTYAANSITISYLLITSLFKMYQRQFLIWWCDLKNGRQFFIFYVNSCAGMWKYHKLLAPSDPFLGYLDFAALQIIQGQLHDICTMRRLFVMACLQQIIVLVSISELKLKKKTKNMLSERRVIYYHRSDKWHAYVRMDKQANLIWILHYPL